MLKLFQGRLSPGETYWLGIFFPGVVFRMMQYGLERAYLRAEGDVLSDRLFLVSQVFSVCIVLYAIAMFRAMILSSFRGSRPTFWNWVGIVLSGLGAAVGLYRLVLLLFPAIPQSQFSIAAEVSALNRSLPVEVTEGMTFRRVAFSDGTMTYSYYLEGQKADWNIAFATVAVVDTSEGKEMCRDFRGYFAGPLDKVTFEYHFADGKDVYDLTAEDCSTVISR